MDNISEKKHMEALQRVHEPIDGLSMVGNDLEQFHYDSEHPRSSLGQERRSSILTVKLREYVHRRVFIMAESSMCYSIRFRSVLLGIIRSGDVPWKFGPTPVKFFL